MKFLRHPLAIALLMLATAAFAFQAVRTVRAHAQPPPAALTALVPQGALLAIESPDFAGILARWNDSSEQKAWLASENFSVFSNSRLYGRLSDAEGEFASASGISAAELLPQVAGRQSVFAWYDIGNLEFLYITRMPPAQQARTELVKSRTKWKTRTAAGIPFYLRVSSGSGSSTTRTVAFATSGDLLLLSTREDLMAGALTLLAHPNAANALPAEPWFADASAALKPEPAAPALHMVLNLDRLVPTPYFHSYWVQQNVSQMKLYRASVADLYAEKGSFREERAILLKAAAEGNDTTPDATGLESLAGLEGVYRAFATTDPSDAITALEDKLLGREALPTKAAQDAPDPSLDAARQGSASDLETRIDTAAPASATFSNEALAKACNDAGLSAVLTWSTASLPAEKTGLFVTLENAVVLRGSRPWVPAAVTAALQQSLRGNLTAANLGIEFHEADGVYTLTGPKPLVFGIRGNDLLIANSTATLGQFRPVTSAGMPAGTTLITGFDHRAQRAPYARLTSVIDGTNKKQAGKPEADATPAFFSTNLRSLSDAFRSLQSERMIEFHDGPILRQTVTYTWQAP